MTSLRDEIAELIDRVDSNWSNIFAEERDAIADAIVELLERRNSVLVSALELGFDSPTNINPVTAREVELAIGEDGLSWGYPLQYSFMVADSLNRVRSRVE